MTPAPRSAVIVGTGLAGGNAAVTLREDGWPGRIVMLGNEPGVPFGRPPLSKTYLRGEESLEGWLVKPEAWYAAHGVELRTGVTVQRVDTRSKQVELVGRETLSYDALLLCTGGRNRRLRVPGAELPGIYQLRTQAECEAIRQAAQPGARAVIVGMGFIGSEVAASLRGCLRRRRRGESPPSRVRPAARRALQQRGKASSGRGSGDARRPSTLRRYP